ncbi:hypothetical protein OROGR_026902 [Orobanche gracilis]
MSTSTTHQPNQPPTHTLFCSTDSFLRRLEFFFFCYVFFFFVFFLSSQVNHLHLLNKGFKTES